MAVGNVTLAMCCILIYVLPSSEGKSICYGKSEGALEEQLDGVAQALKNRYY